MNHANALPSQNQAEFTIPPPYTTNRKSPALWIASHGWRQAHLILLAIVGAIGNAAVTSLVPMITGQAFNLVLDGAEDLPARLLTLALFLTLTQVFRGALQLSRNFGFEVAAQRVERNVRNELYSSLLGKSMTFHNLQPVGDTMARATNDVREVNFFFSPGLNMVIGSLMFLVMPLYLAPRYHPALILTPALFTVLYFVAISYYMRSLEPVTDEVRASFGALNTRLAEALDGIEVVKGAAQEKNEVGRFDKNARRYRDAFVRQGDIEARFWPMLLFFISLAGGLFHALILYSQGLLTVGDVVAYFGILLMLDFPTFTSIWAYSRLALGLAGARRILELMNRENNLDQNSAGFSGQMQGDVAFEGVNFAYDGSEASLSDLNFTVKPGMTVAVVGQTGSGKTTLARLINRTYDVNTGRVLVDGRDVREWNLESLRRQISIIEQDIFLFSQTIRENIAFGNPNASQEEVEKAARMAQAHDFIMTFEKGYDTVIGERGVTLSGGQRQRIALARAFLTDPRILVLDDSTSAIDSATEDMIQRAIFTASRGRTTFIITHRLSQIRWADLILVLRNGQLVASGTHDELMERSLAYRRIFSE
ncbi:MAG TPA: ABC transporter ATP-binding protein [Anaerolineaceae bacterium]|nr:ABC transporter ATP-binding protein [Anaerolineaceae bacterium]HPN52890.1 ABC transporter ATP-binding protein [Anaerolineaceae bacterium]